MRLFIALPLTNETKEKIENEARTAISSLGREAKPIPSYKWHFTLVFLGNQPEETEGLEKAIRETAKEFEKPEIKFSKITYNKEGEKNRHEVSVFRGNAGTSSAYVPPGKKPRMVWLVPNEESNKRMAEIKKKLTERLKEENVEWREDHRAFNGHINLAKFEPTFIDKLPKIEREIDFSYKPPSIELMKSTLKPTGAEYETIFKEDF